LHRFVSCAANLKEDLVLALEQHLTIIQTARRVHQAENAEQRFTIELGDQVCRCALRLEWMCRDGHQLVLSRDGRKRRAWPNAQSERTR